jgi:diguanylate cyclase (GGDEF)-like protein
MAWQDELLGPVDERILGAVPVAIAIVDKDCGVLLATGGTEELFGLPPSSLTGRNLLQYLPEADSLLLRREVQIGLSLPQGEVQGPLRLPLFNPMNEWRLTDMWSVNQSGDKALGGLLCVFVLESVELHLDGVLTRIARGEGPELTLPALCSSLRYRPVQADCLVIEQARAGEQAPIVHLAADVRELPAAGLPGPWDTVLSTGLSIECDSIVGLPLPTQAAAESGGYRAVWSYPVQDAFEQRLAGCLVVWRKRTGVPSPNQAVHLERAITIASLAFGRAIAERQLRHAAYHDPLTGLANRRRLDSVIEEASRLEERGLLALLYVDLDGFKEVNDRHGHVVGDAVLAAVGRRIAGAVRPADVAVRLGGDEFAVMCQRVDGAEEAAAIAQRVIDAVSEPVHAGRVVTQVGASVGIACSVPSQASLDILLEVADRALYVAKASGRGRWSVGTGALQPGR